MEALAEGQVPTEDALEVIAGTTAAAFAIDRHDRIIYWNEQAEKLLGYPAQQVTGRFCFDVLQGRDPFGNRYCTKECPIVTGIASGEEIAPFAMEVRLKGGGRTKLRVRTIPLPGVGENFACLMHVVDMGNEREMDQLVAKLRSAAAGRASHAADPPISVNPLTPREKEILALLSNGYAALNIAAKLNLSHATVRNHIQNILRKMEVHSQVEAIAVAFRRGWI